jgi:hypothetical protein
MGKWSIAPRILNLGVDRSEWSMSGQDCFSSGEGAVGMRWEGDWVDPRIFLNAVSSDGNRTLIHLLCIS